MTRTAALGVLLALALPLAAERPSGPAPEGTVYRSPGALTLLHEPLSCIPGDDNALIGGRIDTLSPITSAVVYFRARTDRWEKDREDRFRNRGLERYEHYVELRLFPDGTAWALLPLVEASVPKVMYRIVIQDASGSEASTPDLEARVTSCSVDLTDEQKAFASNLVIGQTGDAQDEIPRGFKCKGIVSEIEKDGVLKPTGCRPPVLWWGGAILAGAGVGVITTGQSDPVSPVVPPAPAGPR